MKIIFLKAREILDSRGKGTIEVEIKTEAGLSVASVPSGVSVGEYEAVAVEPEQAIKNIQDIIGPALKGKELSSQAEIDEILLRLDGTKNKSKLGANSLLVVSLAVLRAFAFLENKPLWKKISEISGQKPSLPRPLLLCFEGGKHGASGLDFQEIMVAEDSSSFGLNFKACSAIYGAIEEILEDKFGRNGLSIGLEGGFAPLLNNFEDALDLIIEAAKKTDISVKICLDAAASEFYENEKYNFRGEILPSKQLLDFYQKMIKDYPVFLIEDPFDKDDFSAWQNLLGIIGLRGLSIVADDLTATNIERIKMAKEKGLCNGIVIKPNQIGTVSETIKAANLAKSLGWKIIVSHRGGETMDDFIADLAVGLGADYIKAGAPSRPERMVKYKRLMEIEKEIK